MPVAVVAFALFAIADIEIESFGWEGRSLMPWHRSVVFASVWLGGLVVGWRTLRSSSQPARFGFLVALLAWLLLASALGVVPSRSVFVWFGFLAVVGVALAVAAHTTSVVHLALALASGAVVYPSIVGWILGHGVEERTGRLFGVTFEPNMIGHIGGLLAVVGVAAAGRAQSTSAKVTILAATVPAGVAVVYESDTRTAIGALIAAAAVVALFTAPRATIATTAIVIVGAFGVVGWSDLSDTARRDETEELSDFNGRQRVWDFTEDLVWDEPFLGGGLASGPAQFDRHAGPAGLTVFSRSSHNHGWEIARESGVIGLALAAATVIVARPWRRRAHRPILAYLTITAITMPLTGLPGVIVAAWFLLIVHGLIDNSSEVRSARGSDGRLGSVGSNRGPDGSFIPIHQS